VEINMPTLTNSAGRSVARSEGHSEDHRWLLVQDRNQQADGEFVYAVKSTGIFCRPSCPSRRPRREMVEFFDNPVLAQQAGYRACLRCEPAERNAQLARIEAACRFIEKNLDNPISLDQIAGHVGLSPFHFQRLFKKRLGISPRQYQQAQRSAKFKHALQKEARITDAIYEAGYGSSSRAYENGSDQLGMTPTAFRRNGQGVNINYTIIASHMGRLLIASTDRGLCSVKFGNSEAALLRELKAEFHAAHLERRDNELKPAVAGVKSLLAGMNINTDIPLDIQGTAFQQRVWNALRQIPPGQTRSYTDVAKSIGSPKAVRAVASACASNPVALVVPCHRVVQANGKLAGYRWGIERKAALLRKEALRKEALDKEAPRTGAQRRGTPLRESRKENTITT
jgi:AraC family transcriptional regulator, regulatory protein of adaptative response / methylated-DNA-[protein]-cysteine methyltransferase